MPAWGLNVWPAVTTRNSPFLWMFYLLGGQLTCWSGFLWIDTGREEGMVEMGWGHGTCTEKFCSGILSRWLEANCNETPLTASTQTSTHGGLIIPMCFVSLYETVILSKIFNYLRKLWHHFVITWEHLQYEYGYFSFMWKFWTWINWIWKRWQTFGRVLVDMLYCKSIFLSTLSERVQISFIRAYKV